MGINMTGDLNRNHNYKGGSIASNGYKLIYVGKDHHLADIRGYAYEHRVKAEMKIGRCLRPGEQVHHKDGNKLNNDFSNLKVVKSRRHHMVFHRKKVEGLRMPYEENVTVACLCGCGREFLKYDGSGRERKYISGHNPSQDSWARNYVLNALSDGEKTLRGLIQAYPGGKGLKTTLTNMCRDKTIVRVSRGVYKKALWD